MRKEITDRNIRDLEHGNAEDDDLTIYSFRSNFVKSGCGLRSLKVPHLNFSITNVGSVEFQMETVIICRRRFRSQITQSQVISSCYFAEDG